MLPNYIGSGLSGLNIQSDQQNAWLEIYNHTSGTLTNGDIYTYSTLVDITDSANPIIKAIPVAVSTMATAAVLVGVVDNSVVGEGSILTLKTGWLKIVGCVQAQCYGGTDIVKGDQLEVLNASPTAFTMKTSATVTSSVLGTGLILGGNTSAIALESYATASNALKWVYLLGHRIVTA